MNDSHEDMMEYGLGCRCASPLTVLARPIAVALVPAIAACVAGAITIAVATGDAHAQEPVAVIPVEDPAAAASADDDRLRRFLEVEASVGREGRVAGAVVNAVVAAVTIPPGVILTTREDPALEIAGITLLVQGGLQVLSLPFELQRTPLETLHDHYEERTARGEPAASRVAETEREWQRGVEKQRSASIFNAVLGLSLGTLEVAAGMYLLLQDPVLGLDRRQQTVAGALLVGLSLPGFAAAVWSLFPGSSIERAWDRYQAGKPRLLPPASHSMFTVVPTRGGVAGALNIAF